MKEDEFAALRAWGEGLRSDEREEVRAAGRAIVMLAEEVERLQIALWHAGGRGADAWDFEHDATADADITPSPRYESASMDERLRGRLRRFFPQRLRAPD